MSEEINILDKFKGYGFNGRGSITRCIIGDNVFIVKDNNDGTYNFIKISKTDYNNFYENEKEKKNNNVSNAIINYINFDQIFFNKNEDKFIKSLNEQQLNFDKDIVKQMQSEEFKKLKVSGSQLSNINTFKPELIPEPIPKEKEELMYDDDDDYDDDDNERMIDEEEEEEKERMIEDLTKSSPGSFFGRDDEEEEEERPIEQVQDMDKKKDDKEKPIKEEEDKIPSDDEKLNSQFVQYKQDFNLKPERKGNRGKMPKKYSDFFKEIKGKYGFTIPNDKGNTGQAYLRVDDDIIFVRKLTDKTKGTSKYRYKGNDRIKDNNLMIAIMNKSDFPKLDSDNEDVKARFFNFSLDYYKKNKDKFTDAIENKEFIFDQDLQKINDEYNFNDYFLNKENLENYNIIPKDFDYRKVFSNNNQNNQLIAGHTPNGEELRALIKYNNNSDSLLKLIVSLSENNKGEVDFKEIGEIQDLNGDITNLYSDMQELKTKINSSNNEEAKERLLIKYNKKRLKLEDLVKKYSKEAYRLSTLKKKKATMATHKYLMNKLNKLKN